MPVVSKDTVLLTFLFEEMPEISRSRIRQFLREGRILVNGNSVCQHDAPLAVGDKVVVGGTKTVAPTGFSGRHVRSVYEDRFLIVVEKHEGILSMATSHHSFCVKTVLDNYFERTRQRCRAHLVHRLDRDTSGLMIYPRAVKCRSCLSQTGKDLSLTDVMLRWQAECLNMIRARSPAGLRITSSISP